MNPEFKVLIADDEYWIRENLRTLLDWCEHSFEFLEPVADGEQALAAIYEKKPDIVITDVNMPFISGVELIEKTSGEFPDLVFIALSGYSDYSYVRKALLAGAVDYLLKPISKADLLGVLGKSVSRIIAGRKQKMEKIETQEKLKLAFMHSVDWEFSDLIRRTDDQLINGQIPSRLLEYELDFSGFTLVVFRTEGISRVLRRSGEKESHKLISKIKSIIMEQAKSSKSLVFNNIYRNNEFILITEMDNLKLRGVCESCVALIEEMTGGPLIALIGKHNFSFAKLREAYNDAMFALLVEKYCNVSSVVHISETEECLPLKRIGSEQEKQLAYAVGTGKRDLFRKILYDEIKILNCAKDGWRLVEVRQTASSIAWILSSSTAQGAITSQMLSLDNLSELLQLAADSFDVNEMNSIIEQMLDEVFEQGDRQKQSESMRQTVKQVMDYVDAHYFEDLSLTSLSECFLTDSSYLSKAFKQTAGDNLMLYIAKKRIEHAKEYLKGENLSISEISQLVGYGDYAYFSRVFRKITGESPRKFRERAGDLQ